MDKVAKISDYEKENLAEINEFEVSIDDLKKYGLSDEILAYESGLRKFYGDEILLKTEVDDINEEETKKVTKIDLSDMNIDTQFKAICEDIENSEFDENLDIITK